MMKMYESVRRSPIAYTIDDEMKQIYDWLKKTIQTSNIPESEYLAATLGNSFKPIIFESVPLPIAVFYAVDLKRNQAQDIATRVQMLFATLFGEDLNLQLGLSHYSRLVAFSKKYFPSCVSKPADENHGQIWTLTRCTNTGTGYRIYIGFSSILISEDQMCKAAYLRRFTNMNYIPLQLGLNDYDPAVTTHTGYTAVTPIADVLNVYADTVSHIATPAIEFWPHAARNAINQLAQLHQPDGGGRSSHHESTAEQQSTQHTTKVQPERHTTPSSAEQPTAAPQQADHVPAPQDSKTTAPTQEPAPKKSRT